MCDPVLQQEIEEFVQEIYKLMYLSPSLPEDWELVLELGKDAKTGESICWYYFVCHFTRCLFWLHELDLESILVDVPGVTEKAHIRKSVPTSGIHRTKHISRLSVTNQVLVSDRHDVVPMSSWLKTSRSHWEMFPHNREVPEDLVQELSGILLHAGVGMSGPVLNVVRLME